MSGEYAPVIVTIATMLYSVWMIRNQQKTIDRLTDKLMARNYVEYKSMEGIREEDASPPREEESKGWYDH